MYDYHVYGNIVRYDGSEVTVSGVISSVSIHSGDTACYEIKGLINGETKAEIRCFGMSRACDIGDIVVVKGKINKPENTYIFKSEDYYKSKGFYLEMSYPESIEITDGNGYFIKRTLMKYREYIYDRMFKYLSYNNGQMSIVKAMLFGDKSSIDDTTKTLLYRAGIGHIMAVSGVHLTVISSVLWFVLCRIPINKYFRFLLLLCFVGIFVVLAGAANSVIRAAIMLIIVYGGNLFNRRADVMNSLGIAAVLLTIGCPFVVRDASFMLSFAGVIGISEAAPAVISLIEDKIQLDEFPKSFIVSAVVSVIVFPVSFLYFDEVSIMSPLSNVMLMPFCTIILICGMVVACTGGVSFIAFPVMKICGMCCSIVRVVASAIGNITYSYIPMGYDFIGKMIIGSILIVLLITAVKKKVSAFLLSSTVVFSVCITIIMCVRFVPSDYITAVVFSDGKGASSLVIHDNRSASVIDLRRGGRTHEYIKKYLNRQGIFIIDMLSMNVDDNTSAVMYKTNFDLFDIRTLVLPKENHNDEEFLETFCDRIMYYDENTDSVIEMPQYILLYSYNNTVYAEIGNNKLIAYNGKEESGISGDFDIAIEYYGDEPARYINSDIAVYLDEENTAIGNADTYKCRIIEIKFYEDRFETEVIE